MSTHKNIDRICMVVTICVLILCILFMNGGALGLQSRIRTTVYAEKLFDTTRVHTIDIEMDDWDSFIKNCENEEYSACTVVVDNEAFKNVGIRAKGNTSLQKVSQLDSQRYSFKLEFDQYESGKTYHGLDKLCLNNIIQDNTYMKDYLSYRMMDAFGVDAPLCSYAYITVNGEDWGLYLAVEAVEDSFLSRVYGSDSGMLYKPDTTDMGGGKGNGKAFDMDDFNEEMTDREKERGDKSVLPDRQSAVPQQNTVEQSPQRQRGGDPGGMGTPPGGGEAPAGDGEPPNMGDPDQGEMTPTGRPDGERSPMPEMSGGTPPEGMGEMPSDLSENAFGEKDQKGQQGGPGGGMNSDDVKLIYSDDAASSYSHIFENAKTACTTEDQTRLIASLKKLNNREDIDKVVNMDEVMRYFVVHNYVVNGDSYTGGMVHNYYLREKDGQMSMIPWDYNLAFGAFGGGSASSAINDPIDTPLSVSESDDRPMFTWITADENKRSQYHQLFNEFLTTVDVQSMIHETYGLISDYVAKDPTKFCTTDEFKTGVETLKQFCTLRTQSINAQLEGTIPSTKTEQQNNNTSLINASGLNLNHMGTMNVGEEKGMGAR